MKNAFVIHPFLFSIFPILFFFSHNIEQASFSDIILPLATVLGITILFVLVFRLILRDSQKAGIIVSILLVLFFSYGHFFHMIQGLQIDNFIIGRHRYLMLAWGMIFLACANFVIKTRRELFNFTNVLNIASLPLILISLINIGIYEFNTRSPWQDNDKSKKDKIISKVDLEKITTFRDIYYIILDGYANSKTLKNIYQYDNRVFTDFLSRHGFYVAYDSRSNYALTFLSLASSLNMTYINYLSDIVGLESKDRKIADKIIKKNKVVNFLRTRNYKFIHFGSGWGATNRNWHADIDIQCGKGSEFLWVLMQTTMLGAFEKYFIEDDARERVLCTFSKLADVHKINGPKFVFAHILVPHPPYLFGSNGEPVPESELKMSGSVWEQKKDYLNQMEFVNTKVEMLVREIISKSETPPIIILQADHGTASTFSQADSGGWDRPTEKMLNERMRILNAYYLPEDGSSHLYDSITPVNTFRLIFDLYFDTNYKLLTDLSYYSNYEKPYKFINVTDILVKK